MPSFRVTRTVKHSPQQMYDLVADVEKEKLLSNPKGKLVATVMNPKAGKVVKISNLADASPLAVKAVLTTKSGDKVNVARSYVACS